MKNKECGNRLCQEPAVAAGLCSACYGRLRYWLKKSPAEVVRRRQTLQKWSETVEHLIPEVRPLHRRKRAS